MEVVEQVNPTTVRCLAFTTTSGLARDTVTASSGPLMLQVGPELKGRVFDVFGEAIDGAGPVRTARTGTLLQPPVSLGQQAVSSEILTTGVKAVDLLAPIERGGKAGLWRRRRGQNGALHGAHQQHGHPSRGRKPLLRCW